MRKAIAIAATKDTTRSGLSFGMSALLIGLLNLLIVGVLVVRPLMMEW